MSEERDIRTILGAIPGTPEEHAAEDRTLAEMRRPSATERLEKWLRADARFCRSVCDLCFGDGEWHCGLVEASPRGDMSEDMYRADAPTLNAAIHSALDQAGAER